MSTSREHRAIQFREHGDPAQVLTVGAVPTPEPAHGQVRVRMLLSPINPSDLYVVRGVYGRLPKLPATPGFEGVGIVEQSGGGLLGWRVLGRRVAVINTDSGNWQQQVIIPARQAIPVPDGVPDEQIACFMVNPATAYIMTATVLRVPPGEWLLQTAAGSALGKMVIKLGKHFGFRTINVVRRQEGTDQLRQLGADAVINTAQEDLVERVQEIAGKKGVRYALDAVGGDVGSRVAASLSVGGRMLIYGSLSFEPIHLDPRFMIFGSKKVEGFWLTDWMRGRNPLTLLRLFRRIGQLMKQGLLTSDIAATHSMDQIAEAVRQVDQPGRQGKVLLRLN
jgi:NADPH:quinone reductase-like Zn-dependent oxidoreductase